MMLRRALLPLSALVLLAACHGPGSTYPEVEDPDARVVIRFLERYQAHDLPGMMACLEDGAVFQDAGGTLGKPQIERFFRESLEKRPSPQVTFGPPRRTEGGLQAQVRIEGRVISSATWIFILKNHKIHAYSIRPGTP